jgi:hypothetical protein
MCCSSTNSALCPRSTSTPAPPSSRKPADFFRLVASSKFSAFAHFVTLTHTRERMWHVFDCTPTHRHRLDMSRAAVERYVRAIKLFRILVLLLWLVAMGVGGWQV